ncbi:MAG: hypothetical protein OXI30_11095 [Chloroflexota bacterium]|nr:hypothetical protein [Chloroflexota bacterium]
MQSSLLFAQMLTIGMAIHTQPFSIHSSWFWDLNREFNVSSTVASTQLAVVGFVALIVAGLAWPRSGRQSLYLCVLGLVFVFMALDEYYSLHEQLLHWKRYYVALGAALALITLGLARFSPRDTWKWHICVIAGLCMAGGGAVFFELVSVPDVDLGILRIAGAVELDSWEEMTEVFGVWLVLLGVWGHLSAVAPAPMLKWRLMLYAVPILWLLLLYANAAVPRLQLDLLAQPAAVEFEQGVRLRGYIVDGRASGDVSVHLFTESRRGIYNRLRFSLSLVDPATGEAVVSLTEDAEAHNRFWMLPPGAFPLYPQRLSIDAALPNWRAQSLWVVLALWSKNGDNVSLQKALASDRQLLDDAHVILGEVSAPAISGPVTPQPRR